MKFSSAQRLLKLSIRCSIIYCFFYVATLLLNSPEESTSRSLIHPKNIPAARRISTLDCSVHIHRSCMIQNLYIINGDMHVYLGRNFDMTVEEFTKIQDMRIVTGMGFGSHIIRFEMDAELFSRANEFENETESIDTSELTNVTLVPAKVYKVLNDKAREYLIYAHMDDPPVNLSPNNEIILEPTSFFSVLWPNLFRTMYAGVGAWYTQMHYNVFYTLHHRFILMDSAPKPTRFLSLFNHITQFPVWWFDELPSDMLFRVAVMGVSRDVRVAEINNEFHYEERFYLRSTVFRMFCERVKESILDRSGFFGDFHESRIPGLRLSYPRVSLILRDGSTRRVINQHELITSLQKMRIKLNVYTFTGMTLARQIAIIDQTDILVTMHGAALTHILYMRPDTYVLELFPYAFRKLVFKNLAHIMGVNYMYWQNTHMSNSRHNWTAIAESRMTAMPKAVIGRLPIEWGNMDSKNYWRNQDTTVEMREFTYIMRGLLADKRIKGETRYLIYLPWEQLNNQILGLKSACAMAGMLDRTLVIPDIGFRPRIIDEENGRSHYIPYKPVDFIWNHIDRYYDASKLVDLPCRHVSMQNFQSLNNGRSVGALNYIDLGAGATSEDQLIEYYEHVIRVPFDRIDYRNVYYQLSKGEIMKEYGKDESRVLALGSLFSHYDFNVKMEYPLAKYHNFLGNSADPIYNQISSCLQFSERLKHVADRALASADISTIDVAIHYRIGDYREKCEGQSSCLVSLADIRRQLKNLPKGGDKSRHRILFCSTNDYEAARIELEYLSFDWRIVFLQDLIPPDIVVDNIAEEEEEVDYEQLKFDDASAPDENAMSMDLDDNDRAILDQIMSIRAGIFVGNYHSSFSRHIAEQREIQGKLANQFF